MNFNSSTGPGKRAKRQQKMELARSENAVAEELMGQLDEETRARLRRHGSRSGFSFTPGGYGSRISGRGGAVSKAAASAYGGGGSTGAAA
jgi:hypothetical protein